MGKNTNASHDAWQAKNYDRITIKVKKGDKERLQLAALAEGQSVNRYILESVNAAHPNLLTILDDESKKKKPTKDPDTSLY